MKNLIDLLKYKKQIILQGAPGTGKTRLAKLIAGEMTKPINIGSPQNKIDEFFKNYTPTNEIINHRNKQFHLITEFQTKYPKEKLKNLELEKYVLGLEFKETFCWWIEYGLHDLGLYSGHASKFKLYWSKSKEEFQKNGFVRKIHDNKQAMQMIADNLQIVGENIEPWKAVNFLSKGFVMKILYCYYPEIYFPINKEEFIDNTLKHLGVAPVEMDIFQKNRKIQEIFLNKKKQFNSDITNFEFMYFLFTNFDLKGNIIIQKDMLVTEGDYKLVQFHPAYSYEDFIRGIAAKSNEDNQIEYKVENRILADLAEKALDNSKANYVLIIDEINRANLPAVLGELIYAMEYRYDKNNSKDTSVESMYALKADDESDENPETKELKLPPNLYIIGTMNTADRSVGHIDYAIRRRFAFVDVLPTEEPLKDFAKPLFKQVSELFIKNYDNYFANNAIIEKSDYLSPEFRPEDVWIGHSYFITEKDGEEGKKELKLKLKYEIIPILKEYLKDGILKEDSATIINELKLI